MKKILSLFLVMTILITAVKVDANAASIEDNELSINFVDENGQDNVVYFEYNEDGTINGYQTLDGNLIGSTVIDQKEKTVDCYEIKENKKSEKEKAFVKTIKIPDVSKKIDDELNTEIESLATYYSNGTVNYKTYYGPYGNITSKLNTYYRTTGTETGTYTVNGEKGALVVFVISCIVGALTSIGLAALPATIITGTSESIWGAIISTGLTSMSLGKLTKGFTETVSAQITNYELKAYSPSTYVTKYFDGAKYYVTATKSKYANNVYYEGYYPQFISKKDNAVAFWLFDEFYAYSYPGVNW